ncbi:hypothetical protein TNCV_50521 [Trichonephila clavipes]|nr:hypothetical protein TNCV_50521 [Trichonephila clavipes]
MTGILSYRRRQQTSGEIERHLQQTNVILRAYTSGGSREQAFHPANQKGKVFLGSNGALVLGGGQSLVSAVGIKASKVYFLGDESQFLFMNDNVSSYCTFTVEELMESEDIQRLDKPAGPLNLFSIEQM